uniref:Uncharacterized protein n=1 Tax=viral metagenome TaxID=1070528 RepID=A0A6C0D392_9ZZZZ
MLLTELVELLSEHFNISNNAITTILQNNNIRINQRLLLEKAVLIMNKPEVKKNNTTKTNVINEDVETKVAENKIRVEENKIRVEENKTNIENKPTRGRGRPRKNTVMSEEVEKEEEICVEVEEVTVEGITYYKTSENVILSKDLTIEGIMRNGKIVKGVH